MDKLAQDSLVSSGPGSKEGNTNLEMCSNQQLQPTSFGQGQTNTHVIAPLPPPSIVGKKKINLFFNRFLNSPLPLASNCKSNIIRGSLFFYACRFRP